MNAEKCCIISVGIGGWYPNGVKRLDRSLIFEGWAGGITIWDTFLPEGSPDHLTNPYAFKIYAYEWAIKKGFTHILWCDASLYAVKNPMRLFDYINDNGIFAFRSGYNIAQTATDSVLKYADKSRDEAESIIEYASGCVGINLNSETGKKVYLRWRNYMIDGQFKNSRQHDNQSSDPRFLFGRQDQTCLSLAMAENNITIPEMNLVSYKGGAYDEEKVLFFIQGL